MIDEEMPLLEHFHFRKLFTFSTRPQFKELFEQRLVIFMKKKKNNIPKHGRKAAQHSTQHYTAQHYMSCQQLAEVQVFGTVTFGVFYRFEVRYFCLFGKNVLSISHKFFLFAGWHLYTKKREFS